MERGSAQPSDATDDGPDPGALTSAEDSTQQGAGSRPDRGMGDALPPSAAGFNRAFDVYLLAGRRMVKLDDFGANRRAPARTRRSKRSTMLVRPLTLPDISMFAT